MHRIVYLERATLKARVRRPEFAHDWIEHAGTAPGEAAARIRDATIVISNKLALPAPVLEGARALALIAIAATGANHIDLECCRRRGIAVCNVRDYSRHTLPEHVFALLLALRRNLKAYLADVGAGGWQRSSQFCLYAHPVGDLCGSTLAIVGTGMIGSAVARIAEAFGMRVVRVERRGVEHPRPGYVAFEAALREADVLSLHCPLVPETANLIGARELAAMKPTALLINTARGGLVDEAALVEALRRGALGGAGFDVLSTEPPAAGNPLLSVDLPHLLVTPHVAWASDGAQQLLADGLVDNIEAFVRGEARNRIA